jgi:hypothetical protein
VRTFWLSQSCICRLNDPDLQYSADAGRFRYVTESILDRAQKVLTRADADRVSAAYQQQRAEQLGPGIAYLVLRARLLPDRASAILHGEIDARDGKFPKFDDVTRGRMVAALFQLRGRAEMPFVREFFYDRHEAGTMAVALLAKSDVALVEELLADRRVGRLSPAVVGPGFPAHPPETAGGLVVHTE